MAGDLLRYRRQNRELTLKTFSVKACLQDLHVSLNGGSQHHGQGPVEEELIQGLLQTCSGLEDVPGHRHNHGGLQGRVLAVFGQVVEEDHAAGRNKVYKKWIHLPYCMDTFSIHI